MTIEKIRDAVIKQYKNVYENTKGCRKDNLNNGYADLMGLYRLCAEAHNNVGPATIIYMNSYIEHLNTDKNLASFKNIMTILGALGTDGPLYNPYKTYLDIFKSEYSWRIQFLLYLIDPKNIELHKELITYPMPMCLLTFEQKQFLKVHKQDKLDLSNIERLSNLYEALSYSLYSPDGTIGGLYYPTLAVEYWQNKNMQILPITEAMWGYTNEQILEKLQSDDWGPLLSEIFYEKDNGEDLEDEQ